MDRETISDVTDLFVGGWVQPSELTPSPGDIIDFNRQAYIHHGVYVGEGKVSHKMAESSAPVCMSEILLTPIESVAGESLVRVNNHEHSAAFRKLTPRDPEVIVQTAMAEVGKHEEYTLLEFNCEEFATRMRFGEGWSSQANTAEAFGHTVTDAAISLKPDES